MRQKGFIEMDRSKPQYEKPQVVELGENPHTYARGQVACANGSAPGGSDANVCVSGFTAGGPVPPNCVPGADILVPRVCLPLGGQR